MWSWLVWKKKGGCFEKKKKKFDAIYRISCYTLKFWNKVRLLPVWEILLTIIIAFACSMWQFFLFCGIFRSAVPSIFYTPLRRDVNKNHALLSSSFSYSLRKKWLWFFCVYSYRLSIKSFLSDFVHHMPIETFSVNVIKKGNVNHNIKYCVIKQMAKQSICKCSSLVGSV